MFTLFLLLLDTGFAAGTTGILFSSTLCVTNILLIFQVSTKPLTRPQPQPQFITPARSRPHLCSSLCSRVHAYACTGSSSFQVFSISHSDLALVKKREQAIAQLQAALNATAHSGGQISRQISSLGSKKHRRGSVEVEMASTYTGGAGKSGSRKKRGEGSQIVIEAMDNPLHRHDSARIADRINAAQEPSIGLEETYTNKGTSEFNQSNPNAEEPSMVLEIACTNDGTSTFEQNNPSFTANQAQQQPQIQSQTPKLAKVAAVPTEYLVDINLDDHVDVVVELAAEDEEGEESGRVTISGSEWPTKAPKRRSTIDFRPRGLRGDVGKTDGPGPKEVAKRRASVHIDSV